MQEHLEFRRQLLDLFPLMRSLSGEGTRKTHDALSRIYPARREISIKSGWKAVTWIMANADGEYDLLDIVGRSFIPFESIANAAIPCTRAGLLDDVSAVVPIGKR